VFATTVGHYNQTMADPAYLDMITRGLLWSVDRLDEFQPASDETNAEILKLVDMPVEAPAAGGGNQLPQKCCGEGNLAAGRPTKAKSQESGKGNLAPKAVDGDLRTRWCANGSQADEWWQVELERPEHVRNLRIHWEKDNAAYRYTVNASADGGTWNTIVDQAKNEKPGRVTAHQVDAPNTKFLRVTFLGSSTGVWGSFWEFEATAGDLPELPAAVTSDAPSASVADVDVVLAASQEGQPAATFDVSLFGAPPTVNYPVCLAAAPTGEVFVGVDEQGSLGKAPGGGKVLRCVDTDGDGRADKITTFAKMDHPRGLVYDEGSLWVLHPPLLSVWHDDDRDGVADRSETLLTGISSEEVNRRGADHTTNGIRMGIDGWIYIAVGDFGFTDARGTDGARLARRGGGVVRVRPDGKELEIYSWGQRNILDVGIDPLLEMFTRDNTNDGGGWDIRLSHVIQSANYGYPSLFKNFNDEI
ncbi:MAG: discoidin domain-containing protein, partial [Planctomycetales bacterium]|nr:discoidin domain-containing protein [Planctomycetales bacterium]